MTSSQRNYVIEDFELGEQLGEGSYARVVLAKNRFTNDSYALKIVDKVHIVKRRKEHFVMNEKKVLALLDHPGVVKLHACFQDHSCLYFLLELAEGGELFRQIYKIGSCPLHLARFFAAEIVVILEYLHSQNVIHRDLKPENLLLTRDGHLILADFGTAKKIGVTETVNDSDSFVGTAEYVSPELLSNKSTSFGADYWALGCVIFQLLCGRPPFRGKSEYLTFQMILNRELIFPPNLSTNARNLIDELLCVDVENRLGCGEDGVTAIKKHSFFAGILFDTIYSSPSPLSTASNESAHEIRHIDELAITNTHENYEKKSHQEWQKFLLDDEHIVFQGVVSKRRRIFPSKQQLLLTSLPRLVFIDLKKMQRKCDIAWCSTLYVEQCSLRVFYLHASQRQYYIKTHSCPAQDWVSNINEAKLHYQTEQNNIQN